ncbi:MAG: winged helix-turn-helix domain-containing protein [Clostridia bacterium]|nr:winged helix-turn-helix domain-containing protein [Clostridia bacterium]
MARTGCTAQIEDSVLLETVRALLRLEGIAESGEDGAVLITDRLPLSPAPYSGIVYLTRARTLPECAFDVKVVHLPLSYRELADAVHELTDAGDSKTAELSPVQKEAEPVVFSGTEIRWGTQTIHLTPTEAAVFSYLFAHRGRTVLRNDLRRAVWGDSGETNVTDVYIRYLRQKLIPVFGQGVLLTVRGEGYILSLPE